MIETFGACALILEHPLTTPKYLEYVNGGKLYTAAGRAHPGLKGDLKRLHTIVHPASGAIYAGRTQIDLENRTAVFKFGLNPPNASDGREGVIVMANLAALMVEKFDNLVQNDDVLSAGSVIMVRSGKS